MHDQRIRHGALRSLAREVRCPVELKDQAETAPTLQAISGKATEKFNRTRKSSDIDALFRQEDENAAQAA